MKTHIWGLAVAVALFLAPAVVAAAVPQTISYQGYLTNATGQPVNGPVNLTFRLYSVDTGGTALWSETHTGVVLSNGIYSVVLGSGTPTPVPITLPFDALYYLGITVSTDPEMTPRQKLTATPYALRAREADGVAAGSITEAQVTNLTTDLASKAAKGANSDITSLAGLTTPLSVTQGGTGSASQNFVDLTNNQTVAGIKTFSSDLTLSGNLNLPATTATTGIIRSGGSPLMHTFGTNNLFTGIAAGNLSMSGSDNTASGSSALSSNTTASKNTAVGTSALRTQSYDNNGTAWDSSNTAIGFEALYSNQPASTTSGIENTAVGAKALYSNTTGRYNTALGVRALLSNTTGESNLALGGGALYSNTTGNANVAVGPAALLLNTTGSYNAALGRIALQTNTTGSNNIALGYYALNHNISGSENIAIGNYALAYNTTAGKNTALGSSALFTQSYPVVGATWDSHNTAVGFQALYWNQPSSTANGRFNTALGSTALQANTTGHSNTATGYMTLNSNTTGDNNAASGYAAMSLNSSGGLNSAFGTAALQRNTTGSYNAALGALSLIEHTGNYSTAIGYNAGGNSTTGSNNIYIGANVAGVAGESNVTRIGTGQTDAYISGTISTSGINSSGSIRINENDMYFRSGSDTNHGLGWYGAGKNFASLNPDGPVLYGWSGGILGTMNAGQKAVIRWQASDVDINGYTRINLRSSGSTSICFDSNYTLSTCSSDVRMKKDVVPLAEEMDVLTALARLRGVSFTWDRANPKASGMSAGRDIGMIAQEVEPVFPEVVHTDRDGYKSMDYAKLVGFLVEVNKAQQSEIDSLKARLAAIEDMLSKMK